MSSEDIALNVENVSKCYEIYNEPHHRLLQSLFRGKRQYYKEFWALKDISFQVKRGECIGIIGRNGSGKSTLLQIIAGTLSPTSGTASIRGKVAALLELGSGFNPEFTGRENVYLSGAVLGLNKKDIDDRFDDIASFADIGEFIDQPVKTYSSGMLVRLAFAVQTQVEPDILIIDEALAVGDAAFQMKCMGHMRRLLDSGTTVLFVSHDVQAVRALCHRALWLERGEICMLGDVGPVSNRYMEHLFSGEIKRMGSLLLVDAAGTDDLQERAGRSGKGNEHQWRNLIPIHELTRTEPLRRWGSGEVCITALGLYGSESGMTGKLEHLEDVTIQFEFETLRIPAIGMVTVAFSFRNTLSMDIVAYSTFESKEFIPIGYVGQKNRVQFCFPNILVPGDYMLVLAIEAFSAETRDYVDYVENALLVKVVSLRRHYGFAEPSIVFSNIQ